MSGRCERWSGPLGWPSKGSQWCESQRPDHGSGVNASPCLVLTPALGFLRTQQHGFALLWRPSTVQPCFCKFFWGRWLPAALLHAPMDGWDTMWEWHAMYNTWVIVEVALMLGACAAADKQSAVGDR